MQLEIGCGPPVLLLPRAVSSLQDYPIQQYHNVFLDRETRRLYIEKFLVASQVTNDTELHLLPLKLLQPIHRHYVTRSREFTVVYIHAYPLSC